MFFFILKTFNEAFGLIFRLKEKKSQSDSNIFKWLSKEGRPKKKKKNDAEDSTWQLFALSGAL